MAEQSDCYHCGLPVPEGIAFHVTIAGQAQNMCCRGCQAVATAIVENGLEAYYSNRTEMPRTGQDVLPQDVQKLSLYDHPELQRSFVIDAGANAREAVLILEGITCAACVWLNERHLRQLPGVLGVEVNYASHRARVQWDERKILLSAILAEIQLLGYNAHPYNARQADDLRKKRKKRELQRLAIAGIASAQVMMLAVALYAGAWYGIEPPTQRLLRWFSLILTVPVAGFAAIPFYKAAWSGLRTGHLNMDVPVALAILSAFFGSVWVTFMGGTQVYFDTIAMFTLFLLTTRMLENGAQEKSIEAAENLLKLQPAMALRVTSDGQTYVPVLELLQGDKILAKPGETIAADGEVQDGRSGVNESLLTGEARPVAKQEGDKVIAGSVNLDSPLLIEVTGTGEQTVLAGIVRLVDKAQAEKPRIAQLADQVAAWFTYAILAFAVTVLGWWWWHAPGQAFEIVLSVLVVTCPCALSLAVPAAIAASGSHLIRHGILVMHGNALEALAKVNHVAFDKTGTLTLGEPVIVNVQLMGDLTEDACIRFAAGLELNSEHPIARAFINRAGRVKLPEFSLVSNHAGAGMQGEVDGAVFRIGTAAYAQISPDIVEKQALSGATQVWLSRDSQPLALFLLDDQIRGDAIETIRILQSQNIGVSILSGDSVEAVQHIARQLGISDWHARQTPAGKLDHIRTLQLGGKVVAMVGDGINDAPVLAGAQVSFAMGTGTDVASQTSDIVLLSNRLSDVPRTISTGRAAQVVMRQNLVWAGVYNVVALPFAAAGFVAPWVAALGMSISSLIVVLNALRLR